VTDKQILTRAIEKAIAGGWFAPDKKFHVSGWLGSDSSMFDNPTVKLAVWFDVAKGSFVGEIYHATDIIFSHDFAKALWGEEKVYTTADIVYDAEWMFQLQQMVIADNPIQYLGEHLDSN